MKNNSNYVKMLCRILIFAINEIRTMCQCITNCYEMNEIKISGLVYANI